MRALRVVTAAALLVLLGASALGQDEQTVYFSLSSSRTFAPGEKPVISMWAQNVAKLQFRLYRVAEPEKFLRSLDEPHRFGGRVIRPPSQARTPLEKFRAFKRRIRNAIRDFARSQFTPETRVQIREAMAERAARRVVRAPGAAEYAAVPILNPQRLVATWEQVVAPGERWDTRPVTFDVREKGLYLVEATDGKLRAYTIVMVTDLAILSKAAPGRVYAQVVNRRTGAPVRNCEVVVTVDKREIARVRTSAEGVADIRVPEQKIEDAAIMAELGSDFTASSLSGYAIGTEGARQWYGYIYSDRPVYRPGHQVYFRGVVRQQSGPGYLIPDVKEVDAQVQDPEGNTIYRKRLPVSSFGTVNGELTLPPAASIGYYDLQLISGEPRAYGGFQVEEYKKPEYEVKVTPEARRVTQGQPVGLNIQARYYFGEPVTSAKVAYTVHRSRYYPWSIFYSEPEEVGEEDEEDYRYDTEEVAQGTGELDAEGKLRIEVPTDQQPHDLRYRVEARVTDPSNREISGQGYLLATVGAFVLNVRPDQYVYSPGQTAGITVEARDYDGKPVETAFDIAVTEWGWDPVTRRQKEASEIYRGSGRTDASGKGSVSVRIPSGGSYRIRAVAQSGGRDIEAAGYLWVSGAGGFWAGARRERIEIVPDKRSYKPGETAKVLIVTGVPDARVVVSVEGRDLYTVTTVQSKEPTVTFDVPVRSEYAPEVYVSAAFIHENRMYQGMKRLRVPPAERELAVDLKSSKPEYKPGEPAVFSIEAKDHTGKPATAEFSVGVVDESIYAIRREMAQDILKFFYGYGYNRVQTSSSLTYYFTGEAGQRAMQLAQVRRRRLTQLKPERLVDPAVRKAFPDTAFWAAGLVTGADGRAQAKFSFPDALTTWRATARGVTRDTKVGSALHRVIVRKNLMLRLAVPRFFTQGDEVTVSALVHNYLASAKTARVSLDVQGADVLEGSTRDVNIASKGAARVDWRLRAKPGARITLLGKALTDEESDAMELTLPVNPFGVKMAQARAGSIAEPSGSSKVDMVFPTDASPGSRSLEISVTPSLAGAILGALDYLTSYPYGCVEQTMSSFLPNVIVAQAARELALKDAVDEAELKRKIRAGLERLYDFQHEDGSWGWWKTDDGEAFMTAYVIAGLAQARAAGVGVSEDSVRRGAEWLVAEYGRARQMEPDLRAYVVYALTLAGVPDRKILDDVANRRGDLSPYGVALLGLTMQALGDSRAGTFADDLLRSVKEDATQAWWPLERDTLLRFEIDSTPEATAYAVKLLSRLRPQAPVLPKAIAWLINHRKDGYYWSNTKQTAMVIHGVTEYLKLSGELKPDFKVAVAVNGREVLARAFTAADALAPKAPVIRLGDSELPSGPSTITITKSGAGRLYWSARSEFRQPSTAGRGEGDLKLERSYFRLAPERDQGKIVYALEPLNQAVQPGDVIAVRLTLSAKPMPYLMIEDPIPAGAELIERDDLYTLKNRPNWWGMWFTRREFRDDRAAFFQTMLDAGSAEYVYLLKIVNPGVFRVSPGRAGPMYQPEKFASTEPGTLEVRQ